MELEMSELQRTDNISNSPDFQLVDLVKSNKLPEITSLVSDNPDLLNLIFGHPFNKPILYIACHHFVNMVDVDTIKALVDLGADLYHSDELHDNKKAIHFAALGQNPAILKAIVDVVSCDEDKLNSTTLEGNTALNLLIKEGNAESEDFGKCVEILVESGLDVNRTDTNNGSPIFWAAKKDYKEAVNIILTKSEQKVNPDEFVSEYVESDDNLLFTLFGCNKTNEEDSFVGCLKNFFNGDDDENTFLQLATEWHLKKVVEALLYLGADPKKSAIGKKSPVEIAVECGFHEILEIVLKQVELTLLGSLVLKNRQVNKSFASKIDHEKCFNLLINYETNISTALSEPDLLNTTPDRILNLLRKGASMAVKSKRSSVAVKEIDVEVLETHFNECVEVNSDIIGLDLYLDLDRDDVTVTFNYKTLMPPPMITNRNEPQKSDIETGSDTPLTKVFYQMNSEMQVISCMSKSPEMRHLLKHPLITSFLFMKWHRISWVYYLNLLFYSSFCLSLILYIWFVYDKNDEQSTFLLVWLFVMWVGLIFRELFQFLVSPKSHLLDLENLLEIALVILTALILFQGNWPNNVKRQIAAVTILLAAFELVLLIGQHPYMTTNIVMLRTVSLNFFTFLSWYLILIMAFSLSFYILFKKEEQSSSTDNQKFFAHPALSLFKTFVMLTGEFDTGNIDFHTYPETSYVIFMLFVFMIGIILFNLLNSLAVSDTQTIKSDAELIGYVARIKHIAYIDRIFFAVLLSGIPFSITKKFRIPMILIKQFSLFPFYLKGFRLIIQPYHQGQVILLGKMSEDYMQIWNTWLVRCPWWTKRAWRCNTIYLDKQTVKRTKQLIKAHKENQKSLLEEHSQVMINQNPMLEEYKKVICDQKSILEEQRKVISDQKPMLQHHMQVISDQKSIVEEQRNVISDLKPMLEENRKVISELIRQQKIIVSQLEYVMKNIEKQN